jgi:hypothetical protein
MLTPARKIILFILTLIFVISIWSKLRFVDKDDHQPQRWRVDEYPGFRAD